MIYWHFSFSTPLSRPLNVFVILVWSVLGVLEVLLSGSGSFLSSLNLSTISLLLFCVYPELIFHISHAVSPFSAHILALFSFIISYFSFALSAYFCYFLLDLYERLCVVRLVIFASLVKLLFKFSIKLFAPSQNSFFKRSNELFALSYSWAGSRNSYSTVSRKPLIKHKNVIMCF